MLQRTRKYRVEQTYRIGIIISPAVIVEGGAYFGPDPS